MKEVSLHAFKRAMLGLPAAETNAERLARCRREKQEERRRRAAKPLTHRPFAGLRLP